MAGSDSVVSEERLRIERIQAGLKKIKIEYSTIQKAQEISREVSKIDVNKLLKPFTI
jgi:hypothetical protein